MKIDRQIGILSILLQKERVTAKELAERFEVSRRTIIRDIEDINRAGIPIQTLQGQNGGISIMENYKMDKTILSTQEMQAILSGLQSLDSISETGRYRRLMEKLSIEHADMVKADNHILIDLSRWDKTVIAEKIEMIKTALDRKEQIAFTYYSPNGKGERTIEPYHLVFQWAGWYVWGYCTMREDYRMFKLTRITELHLTGIPCEEREVPVYTCDKLRHTRGDVEAVVRFDKSVKWRLIDEWGVDCFEEDEEGNIIKHFTWTDVPSFFDWILTYADKAEILSPEHYRRDFATRIKQIGKRYEM